MTAPATADQARVDDLDDDFDEEPATTTARTPWVFAIWLIIAGAIGELAAFSLTMEKIQKLIDPGQAASCDFNVLLQCSANLVSWQGSVFGFPNPILGLVGWMAPIVVGFALLAGARFARWFWVLFTLGMTFAISFVVWLISQSFYELGTLCPWCFVTWSVTIPTFFAVLFHAISIGAFGGSERVRGVGRSLKVWVAPITIVCLGIIMLLAQLELDFFNRL
ncbi:MULTISPECIES: vitamin K epoxide reductase family protein [unclassified Salinibacterium]|uniref:vitamin K epoxide reductase family protein n=1 Tax=unclassified Salinibacterium TaxID=2632331 RepID=UPI001423C3F6|nr:MULTISPECIES: vitamin K epoxide reductase family protein [unclassified Salinibacterium]